MHVGLASTRMLFFSPNGVAKLGWRSLSTPQREMLVHPTHISTLRGYLANDLEMADTHGRVVDPTFWAAALGSWVSPSPCPWTKDTRDDRRRLATAAVAADHSHGESARIERGSTQVWLNQSEEGRSILVPNCEHLSRDDSTAVCTSQASGYELPFDK